MVLDPIKEESHSDIRWCVDKLWLSARQKKILWSLSDQQMKEMVCVLNEDNGKREREEREEHEKLEEIKKRIQELLDESRKYIYDEKWVEREWYFNNGNEDWLGDSSLGMSIKLNILECVLQILKSLESGISPNDIINELINKYEYRTFAYASNYVILFSKYWEKWKKVAKKRDRKKHIKDSFEYLKFILNDWLE